MRSNQQSSCLGKIRHKRYERAMDHMKSLERDKGDLALHVYRCPHCRGFHVGHPKKGLQRKLRYNRLLKLIERANEVKEVNHVGKLN